MEGQAETRGRGRRRRIRVRSAVGVAGKDPRVQGLGTFSFLPKPASKCSKPWRTPKYFLLLGAGS